MLKNLKYFSLLVLLLAAVSTAANAHSDSAPAGNPVAENLAIVLVIDTSGSMSYTDPERLRETAAKLFIDLLSPEDHLSVITFDHQVHTVVPLQALGGAANKERIKEIMGPRLEPGGYTDYTAALEAAYEQLETVSAEKLRPAVIFLTDGEPNPDERHRRDPAMMGTYMESLWETVSRFTTGSRPVYSIAFSEEVNPAVIERISMLTRGDHHILSTPLDLLVSFYQLLETLKNRQRIIDESEVLEGTPQGFKFPVERQAAQVNLIVENLERNDFNLALIPPQGAENKAGNPSIFKGPGYFLVIFHEPGDALQGQWEAVVSGRGPFRILGNADNPLKAWIIEPAYEAMQPLGEPIGFTVQLTGADPDSGLPLELFIQITRPDQARAEPVEFTGSGGTYRGIYSLTDRPGIYEILVTVLLGGEPAAQASSKIHVKYLPLPAAEFHLKESYRCGETLELDASLFLGGHRLSGGSELIVDHYNFVLSYSDGSRVNIPLYEGGNPEEGQSQGPAGFWSNRLTFDREGEAEAVLLAVGQYRGEEFLLEKNLGPIIVRDPGMIILKFGREKLYTAQGRTLIIPVTVENRSNFEETLKIILPGNDSFRMPESVFLLKPGEVKQVQLDLSVHPSAATGPAALRFSFESGHPLTAVNPASANLTVEMLTPSGYLRQRLAAPGALSTAIKAVLACGILLLGVGLLLYRLLAYPREKLGKLFYSKEGSAAGPPAAETALALSKSRGNRAIVSFNPAAKRGMIIPGSEYRYDLVFEANKPGRLPKFLKGWQALGRRNPVTEKTVAVTATPPGILEAEGGIYTRIDLFHGAEFQSGGFSFKYLEPLGKAPEKDHGGINILEGKM